MPRIVARGPTATYEALSLGRAHDDVPAARSRAVR